MVLLDLFTSNKVKKQDVDYSIIAVSNQMLESTKMTIEKDNIIRLPLTEVATLGGTVSSFIPQLRTVTQTTTVNTTGLYRLANATVGDTLKIAKNGNFWGAFKTTDGASKFAQLTTAGPLTSTTQAILPFDPTTMMMAAVLYSIEKQMDEILEVQKEILSFLEKDKESQIKGDLKVLMNMIEEYKFNWDKEMFLQNNHKQVLDIKRSAEQNIIFYQGKINDLITKSKQLVVVENNLKENELKLEKNFKYYRLALYIYSMTSFLDMILLKNFNTNNIEQKKSDIEKHLEEYNQTYQLSYDYMNKVSNGLIGANVVKGIGFAGKTIGNVIGSIPLVKEGPVDEWLVDSGKQLEIKSKSMKQKVPGKLDSISDSGIDIFVSKFNSIDQIYNQTSSIYFDEEYIYLMNN